MTSSLVYLGSTIVKRVFGKAEEAAFNRTWESFRLNLRNHHERPNRELQRAVYRAYCQATLQACATLLTRQGVSVDGWFRLGALPEQMANAFRKLLVDTPAGVFAEATKQWVERASNDQLARLKHLDNEAFEPPIENQHEGLPEQVAGAGKTGTLGSHAGGLRSGRAATTVLCQRPEYVLGYSQVAPNTALSFGVVAGLAAVVRGCRRCARHDYAWAEAFQVVFSIRALPGAVL